jgi:hypothetical protein
VLLIGSGPFASVAPRLRQFCDSDLTGTLFRITRSQRPMIPIERAT